MKSKEVLVDDSTQDEPIIETPKVETIDEPKKKSNTELIVTIVLIVLLIGSFLLVNHFKKKNENV